MTPNEEFAALIEEAKAKMAWHEEFMHDFDTLEVLRAAIATWEKIAHYTEEPPNALIGGARPQLAKRLREVTLAATKETNHGD